MLSKNNKKLQSQKMEPKQQRFAIKKFTVGVASVLIGTTFALYSGAGSVNADSLDEAQTEVVSPVTENTEDTSGEKSTEEDTATTDTINESATEAQTAESSKTVAENAILVAETDNNEAENEDNNDNALETEKEQANAMISNMDFETAKKASYFERVAAAQTSADVQAILADLQNEIASANEPQPKQRSVFRSAQDNSGITVETVSNLDNVDYETYGFAPTVNSSTQVEVHNGFVHRAGSQNANKFPVMVNASILNKDPNTITEKPYVILKNVGTYQGHQLDMKIQMVDWRKQIKNGGTVYAEAHLYNDPRGKGFGFSGSANGLDYVKYQETYIDSVTGEEVGIKAHRSLLDIDRNELFAISNDSDVTAYKQTDKIVADKTSSPVGTVFYRNDNTIPKNSVKNLFGDSGYRVDFVYDTTNKPLEYSFLAPKNWMESAEIYKSNANRNVTEADRQKYFTSDTRSTNAQNVRKPGVFYGPLYPSFNRYIFGAIPTENIAPADPVQYVADKDQGHTTTSKDEDGNTVQNDGVTRVQLSGTTEDVTFRNESSTPLYVDGTTMSKLVFTQTLADGLTYKTGSIRVYIGEDANGNPNNVTTKGTTKYDPATHTLTWTANKALFDGEVQGLPLTVDFTATAKVSGTGRIVNTPATFTMDNYEPLQTNETIIEYGDPAQLLEDAKNDAKNAIDEAAAKKKDEINKRDDLNQEDKDKALQEVDTTATEEKAKVDATTTIDEATAAGEAGVQKIESIDPAPSATVDKSALQAEVDKAPTVQAGNDYTNADEDKKQAYDDALAEAQKVLADNNATQDQVDAAKKALEEATNGLNGDEKAQDLAQAKDDAKKAIDEAAAKKNEEINNTPGLSDADKQAAKDKVAEEATKAKDNIDKATDTTGVEDAKNTGIDEINKITPEASVNKDALQAEVDKAPTVQAGNDYTNADEDKKQAYDDALKKAQEVLADNNATQDQVDAAKKALEEATNGLNGDEKAQDLAQAKDDAKKAIDEAAAKKNEEINNTPGLSDADKQAAKDKVAEEATKAKDNIDKATDTTGVEDAKNTGIDEINKITPESSVNKDALQAEVDKAPTVQAGNDYTNADEDKKQAYDDALKKAQEVLADDNATQDQVDAAKKALEDATNGLNGDEKAGLTQAKDDAKKAIDEAAAKKNEAIDNTPGLSDADKQAAKDKVAEEATKAKDNIDKATDTTGVEDAKNTGIDEINKITPEASVNKDELQAEVDKAPTVQAGNDYTNADEDKKQAYDDALKKAQEVLADDNATQDQVDAAKKALEDATNGLNGDEKVQDLAQAKDDAKKAIDEAVAKKNEEIDNTPGLSDADKQAAKDKVAEEATKAKDNIDKATDTTGVEDAKNTGIEEINKITPESSVNKDALQAEVDKAPTVQAGNDYTNADEDKKKAYDDALAEAQKVLADDNATQDQVDAAKKALEDATNGLNGDEKAGLTQAKDDAKKAIDEAAAKKNEEINNTPGLSDADKQAAKDKVAEEATKAKDNIDKATDATGVEDAKNTGIDEINKITPESSVNKDALQAEVDKAPTVQAGNDYTNADEDKKKAYDDALAEAQKVLADDNATQDQVDAAKKALEDATNGLNGDEKADLLQAKDDAKKAIDEAAAKKKEEIDNKPGLSDEEKQAAKDKVAEEATKAKDNIDKATDTTGVETAKDNGIDEINKIDPIAQDLAQAKDDAKKAIDEAAAKKNEEIDNTPGLSDADKQAAKDKVAEEATKAKDNIDKATDTTGVEDAKNTGIEEINKINPEVSVNKADLQAEVDKAPTVQTGNDYTNADEDKKKAYDDALAEAQKVLADNNATQDQVDAAKKALEDATNGLNGDEKVQDLAQAKDDAKKAIDEAVAKKNEEIDNTPGLSDADKQAAKDKVAEEATKAKDNIDKATDTTGVEDAKNTGIEEINKITPESSVNKDALQAEADKAPTVQAGNDYTNADEDKKQAYDDALAEAQKVLADNNATQDQVDVAKKALEDATNGLNGDEKADLTQAKDDAKKAIDEAAAKKNEAIDNTPGLSDADKQAAKDKVAEEATKAKDNIDKATDATGVEDAKNTGIDEINKITPEASVNKDELQAEVDKAPTVQAGNDYTNADEDKKQAYDDALKKAQEVLADDNATQAQVDAAKKALEEATNGLNGDEKAQDLAQAKDDAKKAIDEVAAKKKDSIDNVPGLSDEEKQAAKAQVDEEATKAKANIDKATDTTGVEEAKDNGIDEINSINPAPATNVNKDALQAEVDKAPTVRADDNYIKADADKQAIYEQALVNANNVLADDNATQAQVDAAKQALEDARNGLNGNDKTQAVEQAKEDAKKAIDEAAAKKNEEIDKTPGLSDADKQAAKDKVVEEATKAKDNIDKATDTTGVEDAKNTGIEEINKINPEVSVNKAGLQAEVDKAPTIKGGSDYANADKDKQQAYDNALAEAQKVLADDNATQAQVDIAKKALEDATNSLNGDEKAQAVAQAKEDAKKAIDEAAKAKKDAIDNTPGLSDADKQAAKEKVDVEANKAKDNIDKATNTTDVTTAKEAGIDAINKVTPVASVNKDDLQAEVDKEATVKADKDYKNADADKQAAYDKALKEAKAVLADENATQAQVDAAKQALAEATKGLNGIEKAIDEVADAKKEEIDNDPNLSSAAKQTAKAKVDAEANKAKSMASLPSTGDTSNILPLLGVTLLALGLLPLRRKKGEKTN